MSDGLPAALRLKVISPRRLLVDTEAESVQLPSLEGYLGILPGHSPMFVGLGEGTLSYRVAGEEETVRVCGGAARVGPDEVVVVLAEPAPGPDRGRDEETP